ncbi:MAG TPA: GNAT family N-acetyltransferase [Terriglobales bacterium]|nr:GNAT family N-acetyltransferase [Terriglobales bacterium]
MSTPPALSTRVITDLVTLEQLFSEWNGLWNRCPGATSFQRPEWVLAWTQTFQPKLFVVEVRCGQDLVGLAPLFLYRSGEEQVLAPLAASVSDYLDWLIQQGAETEILNEIFDVLKKADVKWDRLDLTDLRGSSPLLKFDFKDWVCERSEETICPVLALPADAQSVEELLSAKLRHNLRTARRRTGKAGQAEIEIASEDTLDEFLTAMPYLHGARWRNCGAPGMLADNNVQEFHRRAAPALLSRGVLRLYGFRLSGHLIAALYALSERNTVYCYLQGFDPAYSALSPGAQILAAVIDDCLRNRKQAVDFLRGTEKYKYAWGARDQQTYRLCLRQRTPAPRSVPPAVPA